MKFVVSSIGGVAPILQRELASGVWNAAPSASPPDARVVATL